MSKTAVLLMTFVVFGSGLCPGQVAAQNLKAPPSTGKGPLASLYAGEEGSGYYVSEVGSLVCWFAENGKGGHVFVGSRDGNMIAGSYWGVPKGKFSNAGTLKVKVMPNGDLKRVAQTGGFPSKTFKVHSIKSVQSKLPGPRHAGFTTNNIADLDGVFRDSDGLRFYVRQLGDTVVFFSEHDFVSPNRPLGSYVFKGKRTGNLISGQLMAVPKGTRSGHGSVQIQVGSNRTLQIASSGISFAKGPLIPILPDIEMPISTAMELVDGQLGKIKIRLDSYENDRYVDDGCYVKIGGKTEKFGIPYLDIQTTKKRHRQTFINDMDSDIIDLKSLGANETRLSIIFESGGHELKRRLLGALANDDNRLSDWDIRDPRVDLTFRLSNYKTKDGAPSVSYEVTDVKLYAWVDAKLIPDGIEQWIASKIRPHVEARILSAVNNKDLRALVADLVWDKLRNAQEFMDKYKLYGYSASNLVPKSVRIKGSKLLFSFL